MSKKPKTFLVLAGGGSKGAYQAGVLEEMRLRGIKIDGVDGISVGAINGGAVAVGAIGDLLKSWQEIRESDVLKRGKSFKVAIKILAGLVGFRKVLGVHDTRPLLQYLGRFFSGRRLKIPFYAGRVDLVAGVYEDAVTDGDLARSVYRSTVMPLINIPSRTASAIWVDGGVHNVTPLARICEIAEEGDTILVILTQPRRNKAKGIGRDAGDVTFVDMIEGTISYLVDIAFERDIRIFELKNLAGEPYKRFNYHILAPKQGLGAGDDYSRETLDDRISQGRRDGAAFFDAYLAAGKF